MSEARDPLRTNAEAIFARAVEIEDPRERARYLEEACGGDERLRAEIEELLRHGAQAGRFREHAAPEGLGATVTFPPQRRSEGPGTPWPTATSSCKKSAKGASAWSTRPNRPSASAAASP